MGESKTKILDMFQSLNSRGIGIQSIRDLAIRRAKVVILSLILVTNSCSHRKSSCHQTYHNKWGIMSNRL